MGNWLNAYRMDYAPYATPFTDAVLRRNEAGMTYSQMEAKTWEVGGKEGSRSAGWWNNMAKYWMATPPGPNYIPGIAAVLKLSQRRVRELIAEQWYGVKPGDGLPGKLAPLVATARGVKSEDLPLLAELAQALSDKYTAELEVEELKAAGDEETTGG